MSELYESYCVQVCESYDEFIFEQIKPYCETIMKQRIPKILLIAALTEYKKNHPDIWEDLTEGESE